MINLHHHLVALVEVQQRNKGNIKASRKERGGPLEQQRWLVPVGTGSSQAGTPIKPALDG